MVLIIYTMNASNLTNMVPDGQKSLREALTFGFLLVTYNC